MPPPLSPQPLAFPGHPSGEVPERAVRPRVWENFEPLLDELPELRPRRPGETTTAKVTESVLEAIRNDRPEVIKAGVPLCPMLAASQLAPRLVERAMRRSGALELSAGAVPRVGRLAEPRRVTPGVCEYLSAHGYQR